MSIVYYNKYRDLTIYSEKYLSDPNILLLEELRNKSKNKFSSCNCILSGTSKTILWNYMCETRDIDIIASGKRVLRIKDANININDSYMNIYDRFIHMKRTGDEFIMKIIDRFHNFKGFSAHTTKILLYVALLKSDRLYLYPYPHYAHEFAKQFSALVIVQEYEFLLDYLKQYDNDKYGFGTVARY